MKYWLLTITLFLCAHLSSAQQAPAILDSLKAKLAKATSPKDKIDHLASITMTYMNVNLEEAEKWADEMLKVAEMSRQRNLMAKAYFYNGHRYGFLAQRKEYLQKSIDNYNQSLTIAKGAKLDKETTEALLGLADIYTKVPELDKSLSYTTQAIGIANTIKDDSLQVASHLTFGNIYGRKKERLLSLRSYLQALRIAEESKQPFALRSCYSSLSNFYAGIKENDKAIDFAQKALEQLPQIKEDNAEYLRVIDMFGLGNLYMQKKNFKMSKFYFEESIRLADSLNYAPLKNLGYNGLLNQYLEDKQPQEALAFFNRRSDMKQYASAVGFGHTIDAAYGVIFTRLKQFDSAKFYFAKAAEAYETRTTPAARITFYAQNGDLYNATGELPKAIAYYTRAKGLADTLVNLEWQQATSKELDSLYAKSGDYKQSRYYNNLYYMYKDSLQKLGEQRDLMQAEMAAEQQRQEMIKREETAALERKHALQYTGISIAIATVFVLLVAMGIFRVSETTIKIMGFFSFILLFEFIILIADQKIHHWTHGEPLPILGIKIVLIAALLPLHHWLEHKVVHYLASRRLIIPSGRSLWNGLVRRRAAVSHGHELKKQEMS